MMRKKLPCWSPLPYLSSSETAFKYTMWKKYLNNSSFLVDTYKIEFCLKQKAAMPGTNAGYNANFKFF